MNYRNALFISFALVMSFALSQSYDFVKLAPTEGDSNGKSIEANCSADYPDATATMDVNQSMEATDVTINVSGAQPNTLFTVWLWLKGTDAAGNSFGGNPLSGKSGAPFAPSTAFAELRDATGSGNGVTEGANVFTTDAEGNATFSTTFDFPLFGGVYPFHKIEGFEAGDERFVDDTKLYPVEVERFTSGSCFDKGKQDPEYLSKSQIALGLIIQSIDAGVRFRAVVADSFYEENRPFRNSLLSENIPFVLAAYTSHSWWHFEEDNSSVYKIALAGH